MRIKARLDPRWIKTKTSIRLRRGDDNAGGPDLALAKGEDRRGLYSYLSYFFLQIDVTSDIIDG